MGTVAQRCNANSVSLPCGGMLVRGYDFVPAQIGESEKDFIFRSLFPVGLEAFVQNPSEAMEKDVADHIFTAEHLLVMRSDGTFSFGKLGVGDPRPVAFRMWKTYSTPIGKAVYLAGMCVLPAWQGTGIGKVMTQYVIDQERPDWVFTITQNPVAKQSLDSALGNTSYPLFTQASGGLRNNAQLLADVHGVKNYNPETMVIEGHYGGALYGKMPVSRDWRYEALFQKLDRANGDAYLIVAKT